jgi:hypothetical protein
MSVKEPAQPGTLEQRLQQFLRKYLVLVYDYGGGAYIPLSGAATWSSTSSSTVVTPPPWPVTAFTIPTPVAK